MYYQFASCTKVILYIHIYIYLLYVTYDQNRIVIGMSRLFLFAKLNRLQACQLLTTVKLPSPRLIINYSSSLSGCSLRLVSLISLGFYKLGPRCIAEQSLAYGLRVRPCHHTWLRLRPQLVATQRGALAALLRVRQILAEISVELAIGKGARSKVAALPSASRVEAGGGARLGPAPVARQKRLRRRPLGATRSFAELSIRCDREHLFTARRCAQRCKERLLGDESRLPRGEELPRRVPPRTPDQCLVLQLRILQDTNGQPALAARSADRRGKAPT